MERIIYYKDENEEFSGIVRRTKTIDENFKYNKNFLWKIAAAILYRLVAVPMAFLYTKLKFGLKIENRKILKKFRKGGYFLYGNHTQVPGDGFIQGLVSHPKKSCVITNADTVSLRGTTNFIMMLGAMPLPTTRGGYKNFINSLKDRCEKGRSVVIYPEAHIWPYYTGIRKFSSTAFNYPVMTKKPVFSFTAIYKKRKRKPKMVVKIDGPFFADDGLSVIAAQEKLCDEVYKTMVKRAAESNFEYIKYVKV